MSHSVLLPSVAPSPQSPRTTLYDTAVEDLMVVEVVILLVLSKSFYTVLAAGYNRHGRVVWAAAEGGGGGGSTNRTAGNYQSTFRALTLFTSDVQTPPSGRGGGADTHQQKTGRECNYAYDHTHRYKSNSPRFQVVAW